METNENKSCKQRWSGPRTLALQLGPVMASSPLNVHKISIWKDFSHFLKIRTFILKDFGLLF